MATHEGPTYMPMDVVESAFDFVERSGMREARLLGGEPTIHPEFDAIVARALARGLRLLVFSGGFIPEKALGTLEAIPEDRLNVLLNVIPPNPLRPSDTAKQEEVFRRLGRRVVLGLTIDSPGVDLVFLLDLIEQYDLARVVRLGLAHPILNGENSYLHPRHYPEVGRRTTEFGLAARERGVSLSFDCGWVPCMFPPGAMQALGLTTNEVGLRCSPILDLLPNGTFISCYPLAAHATEPLAGDAAAVRARFITRQAPDRTFMLYKHCVECDWRARGECTGGCLSASLRQLRRREFAVAVAVGA
jgi:hypothetical protein